MQRIGTRSKINKLNIKIMIKDLHHSIDPIDILNKFKLKRTYTFNARMQLKNGSRQNRKRAELMISKK